MTAKNALLISVRPKFAKMIFEKTKTVELRRVKPRVKPGELVFLYESSPTKALRGAFEIARVISGTPNALWEKIGNATGLSHREYDDYFSGTSTAFAIVIKKVWALPTPIHLARLRAKKSGFLAPQSYHYVCKHQFARLAGLTETLERQLA